MAAFTKYSLLSVLIPVLVSPCVFSAGSSSGRGADMPIEFVGGSLRLDYLTKSYTTFNPNAGQTDTSVGDAGQQLDLDFRFNAAGFAGDFRVNAFGNAVDSDFEQRYGDRLNDDGGDNIELYNFEATYLGDKADINLFYHKPRFHWGYEGDMFGLMKETTDMSGQDIWNNKAPRGIEVIGKGQLDGLKVVAGPEVYWEAKPMVVVKHQFGSNKQYSLMLAGETESAALQTSLQGEFDLANGKTLEVGGLISGTEEVGELYDYYTNSATFLDTISNADTVAWKAKLGFDLPKGIRAYTSFNYAGLVATSGDTLSESGSQLPYSDLGNKKVFETGMTVRSGHYTFIPRLMYRQNLLNANPATILPTMTGTNLNPGIVPRNTNDDPFVVSSNRAASAAEIYLTYDPTPATHFYEWDNDVQENAKFAYNLGLTVTNYQTLTDSPLTDEGYATNVGQEADNLWLLKSRMVFNTAQGLKTVVNLEAAKQQPAITAEPAIEYQSIEGKLIHNQQNIYSLKFAKDKWGPYDFHRDWNTRYPQQFELGYVRLLDQNSTQARSSKFGVKAFYRTLDENSGDAWSNDQGATVNEHMYEVNAYYTRKF